MSPESSRLFEADVKVYVDQFGVWGKIGHGTGL